MNRYEEASRFQVKKRWTIDRGCPRSNIAPQAVFSGYLIYFLANVAMKAAHIKVPSMASSPATSLKSGVGL